MEFRGARGKWQAAGVLGAAFIGLAPAVRACELVIVWRADLTGPASAPPALAPASGTATVSFDFVHPGATVRVDTKNVSDVRSVELHVSRSYTDHAGPAVFTLYSPSSGPLPAVLTKRVTEADVQKQSDPKIASLADVVHAVLNGRAYVTVATKAHPEGELTGFVTMRKEAVYSNDPGDATHNSALHHAAQKAP